MDQHVGLGNPLFPCRVALQVLFGHFGKLSLSGSAGTNLPKWEPLNEKLAVQADWAPLNSCHNRILSS